jgi:hypothetical protein
VTCRAFQKSQKREGSKGDVKNKAGEEADKIIEVWGSDYTEPDAAPAEYMPWASGELSLLKGVLWQEKAAKRAVNQENRRVLKHMRFDKVAATSSPQIRGR